MIADSMEFTGERMVPEASGDDTLWEHVCRYRFACRFAPEKDILDIACGEGYGAAALAKVGARSVVGVDISVDAVEHARARYGIDARIGAAAAIPLPNACVDLVVSYETIEHVSDPLQFVREIHRVSRPRAELIISTPFPPVYDRRGPNPFHISEMMPEELLDLFRPYFALRKKYMQGPVEIPWYSPLNCCATSSPWFEVRGPRRLLRIARRQFCGELSPEKTLRARKDTISSIMRTESWVSKIFNPYSVRRIRRSLGGLPTYVIFHFDRL